MSKKRRNRKGVKVIASKQQNMLLSGSGANTLQDRGSLSTGGVQTRNPYFSYNTNARWQEYTKWYMTAWEARKIIDIPVEDALRKPVEIRGLRAEDEKRIWDTYHALNLDKKIKRALIQERLYGGSLILPLFIRPKGEKLATHFDIKTIEKGDLKAVNIVDISKLSRSEVEHNPFSPLYDSIDSIKVNNTTVHSSRCIILDGDALLNRATQSSFEGTRANTLGFGESKLATLYDLLNRAIGTQQGAYHLVNMASCLLVSVDHLRSLQATSSPAYEKMQELVEQISMYRGAIIDAKDASITQHSASFGSVPELVMTFAQLLSAASDIPATRFLGQSPGGLNATGEGDQTNYYDMVGSYQRLKVRPVQHRMFHWIGASLWGYDEWEKRSATLELHYPSLKTMSEKEEAELHQIYASFVQGLVDSQVISAEEAIKELLARKVFLTEVQAKDFVTRPFDETTLFNPLQDIN